MNPLIEQKLNIIAQSAYTTLAGIRNTYECASRCIQQNIPGDFVECGVAAGAQIGVMGVVAQENNTIKKIWGYDSYQGIPLASEKDDCQPGIGYFNKPKEFVSNKESLLVSSGITCHAKSGVVSNIARWGLDINNYNLVEGWFQHTLPIHENLPKSISLLRLDGDMYESTKVCLEYLFPLLSIGGIVIVDDYALKGCRTACDEYLVDKNISEIYNIGDGQENYGSVYFIKKINS